jgi:hypothetical protein
MNETSAMPLENVRRADGGVYMVHAALLMGPRQQMRRYTCSAAVTVF